MANDKEERHLRMVVNNDPDYRPNYGGKIAGFKEKTYQDRIKELEQKVGAYELQQIQEKKFFEKEAVVSIAFFATGAIITTFAFYLMFPDPTRSTKPQMIIPLNRDLNSDNVNDAYVVQKDKHKVPMYGVDVDTKGFYVSAKDIKERRNDIIDYQSIEDKLNKE